MTRQFGFRKQRSKIDAMSKYTTKFLDGLRRKEKTTVIFFDTERRHDER